MKLFALLAGLSLARRPGAAEAVSRERYLRHLESCPEMELRKRLDFKLEKNDILGAREIMEKKEVYLRIRDEDMDGYFAMVGMMLTDGIWHSRYVEVFEKSGLDMGHDEGMIKELMDEMVAGEIWRVVCAELAETAAKGLEKSHDDARRARGEDVRPSSVVYHVAWEMERRLRLEDRMWARVLLALLRNRGVAAAMVQGRYDKELRRIITKGGELKHVLYGCVLGQRSVLDDLVENNKALAREIVAGGIDHGYWLYIDELEEAMRTERVRNLFPGGDVFGKISAACRARGELSIGRLKELGRERKLDKLVKGAIGRLIRYGRMDELKELIGTLGEDVFEKLVSSGELVEALEEGMKRLVRYGKIKDLKWLTNTVGGRVFDGLLSRKELDVELREGTKKLIRHGQVETLKWMIETMGKGVFDRLVSSGELDTALTEGIEGLITHRKISSLKRLLKAVEGRFGELVSRGELDSAFAEGIEGLIKRKRIDALRWLAETMKGRFDGLARSGKLDTVLAEEMESLVGHAKIDDLKWLVEALEGRVFDGLVGSGELDTVLGKRIQRLTRNRQRSELKALMGIEAVRRRAPGRLVGGEELDTALADGESK